MGWLLKKDFQSIKIESWEEMAPSLQLDRIMSACNAWNYGSYLVTMKDKTNRSRMTVNND